MSAFTQQQHEALEKAYSLLTEQFESVLIAVLANAHDGEQETEVTKIYHYGGRVAALGLCRYTENQLLNIPPKEVEPDA